LKNCIFCKIVCKEIKADIVAETNNSIAFKDINPQAKFHILIIPKIHIKSTVDICQHNIHLLSDIILLSNQISKSTKIISNGYRWVFNTGKDGGQTVDHLHMHLIGGQPLNWSPA